LSAIKPVNSGTVSVADAIAQAKAFAIEKGISPYDISRAPPTYQSHDPRAGDARHYRSRSRSPASRRDAYRDNFNPYRDERREDSRGGAREYGRERSMSPGPNRGRPATFSPRGSSGRGGGGDDDVETIQIESSLVGLIIGRQGENLRRVESETGCRVQFITGPDNQGPYRQCRISGPRASRAEAKAAIDRIIEDSGMGPGGRGGQDKSHSGGRGAAAAAAHAPGPATLREGEDCMQIMVPDRTVGLIIGRGGETIRDLQDRTGCHINIVGESKSVNGLRPVNLIGTPQQAAQAKEQILEIVDSDSRNVNGGGGGGGGAGGAKPDRPHKSDHGRDNASGGGDKIQDAIYVPSEAVGMIIGKGGETIKEMQNTTGCKINVSQTSAPGENEREIGLVGSREAISRAKLAIEDKVDAVVSNSILSTRVTLAKCAYSVRRTVAVVVAHPEPRTVETMTAPATRSKVLLTSPSQLVDNLPLLPTALLIPMPHVSC
jgi:far upstream element-binding protein